ncbi:hypothetical protein ACFL55_03340 [Candidatus Latescibacterota bacterium]
MSIDTIISCSAIFCGVIIIFISLINTRHIINMLPFVRKLERHKIKQFLRFHIVLMTLFLLGYVVVLVAFAYGFQTISKLFVSAIFLLGAFFVYTGIAIQSKLLSEIQSTLQGLIPICAWCKKILAPNSDSKDPKSWFDIDDYLSAKADVNFTHGICPDCFQINSQKITIN